jgi:AcrR family transcriptional regulator
VPRTQAERKAETRQRLLDAAADLFAERGIEGVSIDTVAEAADRTSGAVYAHFGGKEGVLTALLDEWKNAVAAVVAAEFETAATADERLAALWRNFVDPPTDDGARWLLLEHELWLYAARHPSAGAALAARYAAARAALATAVAEPTLVIALLLGLEMQRRVDPTAVDDDLAARGLRALLQGGDA